MLELCSSPGLSDSWTLDHVELLGQTPRKYMNNSELFGVRGRDCTTMQLLVPAGAGALLLAFVQRMIVGNISGMVSFLSAFSSVQWLVETRGVQGQ